MKKLLSAMLALVFAGASLFAGPSSFIKITSYDDGDSVYLYEEAIEDVKITINGSVSSDCKAIRCIWSKDSQDAITDYLLNDNKKAIGIDDFTLTKYKEGSTTFEYNAGGSKNLSNLQWGSNYYLFIAKLNDGTYKTCRLTLYAHQGGMAERGKPVIYLYPTKKTTVFVKVEPKGGVTVSIPDYKNGWKVTALPDGTITDKKTKENYPYLFWESNDYSDAIDTTEGFVVETAKLEEFFNEKLAILGLNKKEIADFNEFWIAEINKEAKPYTFITFNSEKKINEEAPLTISPKPDSVIRVYFDHIGLDEPIETKEQTLTPATRSGFAVVEWGGRKYK